MVSMKAHVAQIFIYVYIEIVNQFVLIVHIQILSQQTPDMYLLWANQVLCVVREIKNDEIVTGGNNINTESVLE